MFRNIYYDYFKSVIHLWYTKNGERLYKKENWCPYVFVPINEETNIKTIYGDNVIKKKFNNYGHYKSYLKENSNYFENKVKPETQYLAEKYHHIDDDTMEIPELKIYALDIEVYSGDGEFPKPTIAKYPIPLISLYQFDNNKVYSFGLKEYTDSELDEDVEYYQYDTEKELLKAFIDFFHKNAPDVLTGWNIIGSKKLNMSGFDLQYIINRCEQLLDEGYYNKLSPVNNVFAENITNDDFHVDIYGISVIDYMAAYKWYSRNNPESYSLDFISNLELGEGKLEYSEYNSLKQLYENNWNKYVDYNIIDVKRIKELEDKLSYIKLTQSMSLLTKCQMNKYQSMVSLLEGRMLTYYRKNNLCAPKLENKSSNTYPAAYIKNPHKGLHHWIFSVDIASSYPTAIVICNMSIETYIGKITNLSEDDIIYYTSKREFPEIIISNYNTDEYKNIESDSLKKFNLMLKKGLICITPCGTIFKTNKEGVIAHVEKTMFMQRKKIKNKMIQEDDKNKKLEYDTRQNAIKVLINSFYGILAFPYGNRYVNIHIAEAITSCGRHAIKQGEKFGNEIFNNPNEKMKNILLKIKGL